MQKITQNCIYMYVDYDESLDPGVGVLKVLTTHELNHGFEQVIMHAV
jgi:hypothetical protein